MRPIHHRLSDRVRARIFLCMLAYYVEWHMREAWLATRLAELSTLARNTFRTPGAGADVPTFDVLTTANPKQQRAIELLQQIRL